MTRSGHASPRSLTAWGLVSVMCLALVWIGSTANEPAVDPARARVAPEARAPVRTPSALDSTSERHRDAVVQRVEPAFVTLLDLEGQRLPGLRVLLHRRIPRNAHEREDAERATENRVTDGRGRLALSSGWLGELEIGDLAFPAGERGAVSMGLVSASDRSRALGVVVVPTGDVRFRAETSHGEPLAARAALIVDCESRSELQELDYSELSTIPTPSTVCGSDGHGALRNVPCDPRLVLKVWARGFQMRALTLAELELAGGTVVLGDRARHVVRGRVRDLAGAPCPGARLRLAQDRATADDRGEFELILDYVDDRADLVAFAPGVGIGRIEGLGARILADGAPGELVEVVVRPAESAIEGLVVDALGRPLEGVRVALADGMRWRGDSADCAEFTARGRWGEPWATSDAAGRFRIEGLLDRDYRLLLADPRTLLCKELGPFPAGGPAVELVVAADDVLERLEGRAIDGTGRAVANVSLCAFPDARFRPYLPKASRSLRTDAKGRFVLEDVAKRHVRLVQVDGRGELALDRLVLGAEPVLHLEFERDFVVSGGALAFADSFAVLDVGGRPLSVAARAKDGAVEVGRRIYLETVGGGFPRSRVSERARWFVLYSADEEIGRYPLALRGDGLCRVEL